MVRVGNVGVADDQVFNYGILVLSLFKDERILMELFILASRVIASP